VLTLVNNPSFLQRKSLYIRKSYYKAIFGSDLSIRINGISTCERRSRKKKSQWRRMFVVYLRHLLKWM